MTDLNAGTVIGAHQCHECGQLWEHSDLTVVYECGQCGDRSDERRCNACNRFMARTEEPGCPDDFGECEPVEAVIDHDGTIIPAEDWEPEGAPLAARTAAKEKSERAAREAARAEHESAVRAAATATIWGNVKAGDGVLVTNQYTGTQPAVVLHARRTPAGQIVAVMQTAAGTRITSHDPTDPADTVTPPTAWHNRPYGSYQLTDPEENDWPSGRDDLFTVRIGPATDCDWMPSIQLVASAKHGNMLHTWGMWTDPTIAAQALDMLERAAHQLAAHQNTTISREQGNLNVTVEESYSYGTPTGLSNLTLLTSTDHAGVIQTATSMWTRQESWHVSTCANPHTLAAVVAEARTHLHRLTGDVRPDED